MQPTPGPVSSPSASPVFSFQLSAFQFFSLFFLLLLSTPALFAGPGTRTWLNTNAATASWNRTTNWSPTGIPASVDSVFIDNSGTATLATGVSGSYANLSLGSVSGSSGFVSVFGGVLTGASTTSIGDAGIGGGVVTSGTWIAGSSLYLGKSGTGTLLVNGGKVSDSTGFIGYSAGSSGAATVTSGTWATAGNLFVGRFGTGTLLVNGGYVSNNIGLIGASAGNSGVATVTSGTWANGGDLNVGYSGTGTLNLTGSGLVSVGSGTLYLATNAGSTGTLNLGTGTTAGTLTATTVTAGSGTATVTFFQSGTYTFAPTLTGTMTVNAFGATILTGNNTYTGTTTAGGDLQIGNSGTTGTLGTGTVIAFHTLAFNRSDSVTVSNTIIGPGTLSQIGAGSLILTASNDYSGGTLISSGTLEVANNATVGRGGVTVSSGAFLMEAGVDIQNTITVTGTGATIAHDVVAGNAMANTIHATSAVGGANLTAMILSGTASATSRIIADFDTASSATNDDARISDVFTLSGVPVVSGSATDIFTLQLSATSVSLSTAYLPYIAWLDGNNVWVNAVTGNTGGTASFVSGAWNASYGLGTYGLDSINNTVWAVLNHNSEFAIVPEPATLELDLTALALAGLLVLRRRRNRRG